MQRWAPAALRLEGEVDLDVTASLVEDPEGLRAVGQASGQGAGGLRAVGWGQSSGAAERDLAHVVLEAGLRRLR